MKKRGTTTPQDNPLYLYAETHNMTYDEMIKLSGIPEATFFHLLRKARIEFDDVTVGTARKLKAYFKIKLI
jgi:hypothetical protein